MTTDPMTPNLALADLTADEGGVEHPTVKPVALVKWQVMQKHVLPLDKLSHEIDLHSQAAFCGAALVPDGIAIWVRTPIESAPEPGSVTTRRFTYIGDDVPFPAIGMLHLQALPAGGQTLHLFEERIPQKPKKLTFKVYGGAGAAEFFGTYRGEYKPGSPVIAIQAVGDRPRDFPALVDGSTRRIISGVSQLNFWRGVAGFTPDSAAVKRHKKPETGK